MAEKVRRRVSKWDVVAEDHMETEIKHDKALLVKVDSCIELAELKQENHSCSQILRRCEAEPCLPMNVAAEHHVETGIKHENALPGKIGDSCIELAELNHESHDCNQILRPYEAEACLPINVDGSDVDESNYQSGQVQNNIKHENALPGKVVDSCIEPAELNHESQDCSQILRPYEAEPCLPINVDGSDMDESNHQSGHVQNNNITHSDNFCEKPENSKIFDLEGESLKKQDLELASQGQTTTDYSHYQDKPLKGTNVLSPGPDERAKRSGNISPTDGWSRSGRKRSRSRSLSYDPRSRSSSYASKQGCESWVDKGSKRHVTEACRDFIAGRCRRGSECRYLHEGVGWRQIDRHHDSVSTDERESILERGRHHGYGSRESFTDSRENKTRRHEDHFDDERDNNEQHRGYRSNETCFNFTVGRCHRGPSCRYIHRDASSDDGRNVGDASRGRVHDVRDGRTSFGRRLEPQMVRSVPCKFFLEGRCNRGESCKFFHQVGPICKSEDRSHDDSSHHYASAGDKASERQDQAIQYGTKNSLLMGSVNDLRVGDTQPVSDKDFTSRSLSDSYQTVTQEFPANVNTEGAREGKEVDLSNNILPITSTASQIAPQLANAQKFASNSPFQQFPPQLPLNGQMQQVILQSGQNPFTSIHKPLDAHYFNASMQNHHPAPNPLGYGKQVQQGLLMQSHVGNQQKLPLPHNGQIQPNLNVSNQIQQNLPSQVGHSQQGIIISGDMRHVLPKSPSNPQNFSSDEKNYQLTHGNNVNSLQQPKQIGMGQPDSSEVFNSDNLITHKVVTSEQAAKIIDLSASLAQFFGTSALNSQTQTGMPPPAVLKPGSHATEAAEGSQTNLNRSASSKEVEKIVNVQTNKEHMAQLQSDDAEVQKDEDGKKSKDAKGFRMFKCALVEFVKDMLKPTWKEGQLSKEAHNTIVKKVVEKVSGSLQGPNIPQTQEKIDLYLSNSKAKVSKLVQAYVEKYVRR